MQTAYKKEITFNLTKILHCINHISHASNVVTAIYHSTQEYSGNTTPMETDGLGFVFPNEKGEVAIVHEQILDWVLRKAFEDCIVGLSQSLIETCRYLQLYTFAKESEKSPVRMDEADIDKKVKKIEKSCTSWSIPKLFKEIEDVIGITLPYKEEMLSINKVRNCLVHRNGIVSSDDINNPASSSLVLRYSDPVFFIQVSNQFIELTVDVKRNNIQTENLYFQNIPKSLSFPEGEKINITPNVFKAITYTNIAFIQCLVNILPIPEDLKSKLIQPLQVRLAKVRSQ